MGSQTSTARQQAFSDAYSCGMPDIGTLQLRDIGTEDSVLDGTISQRPGAFRGGAFGSSSSGWDLLGQGQPPLGSSSGDDDNLIPCVFTWTHGGNVVYLTGSFNGWSVENKFRLSRNGHEFSYIQNLPRGVHFYKFIVDGQWRFAPDQPTQTDEQGNINNVLDISGFRKLQFKTINEVDQERNVQYHQCVPEPSDYATDAPPIPTLLAKSTISSAEAPPRGDFQVHCSATHLYHDSHAPFVFGPQVSCLATTLRWQSEGDIPAGGQRYATYVYMTMNPLYPFPAASEDGDGDDDDPDYSVFKSSPNFSKDFVACRGAIKRCDVSETKIN